MRRMVRQPARDRILIVASWALLAALHAVPFGASAEASALSQALVLLLVPLLTGVMVLLTLWTFVTRATIDGGTLTLHALRRRERLRVDLDRVVGYHIDSAGDWWVHTRPEGTRCTDPAARTRVAVQEPWELHRFFVESAPQRLGGRRWSFNGVPPREEFRGLWIFDVDRFASRALPQTAGVLLGSVIGVLLTHHRSLGGVGQLAFLLLVPLVLVWERLDVTDEGLVHRSPLHRLAIRWVDVRAVFQEGGKGRRSFVFVGPRCAIHIPAHLAIDQDLIEKMAYSLPKPVLCVNFDETTFRGYRRRKKAKEKAPQEDLLPALTH